MIDIVSVNEVNQDLGLFNTQVPRAANIISVQVGSLAYAPEFGVDLKYFLSEDFQFQNESFRSYVLERLALFSINIASVTEVVEAFTTTFTYNLSKDTGDTSLIAR